MTRLEKIYKETVVPKMIERFGEPDGFLPVRRSLTEHPLLGEAARQVGMG